MMKLFVLTKMLMIRENEISSILYKAKFYDLSDKEYEYIKIKRRQIKELSNDIVNLYNEHNKEILSLANFKSNHLKLIISK